MKFSVIIPVYNCEDRLSTSVNSILSQTYKDWELILVNDGSKDNSLNVCREYERKDSRVRVYDQMNSGPSTARNTGLSKAFGEYILFCDADDFLADSALDIFAKEVDKSQYDVIFLDIMMQ